MKKTIVLSLALLAAGAASRTIAGPTLTPEQAKQVDAICAKTACRAGGFNVAIGVDSTHYTNVPVSRSPFVTPEGDILIFPGETIAVQFAVAGDTLSAPRLVAQYQTSKDLALRIDTGTRLIDNPLDATLPALPEKDGDTDMGALPPNTVLIAYGQLKGHLGMVMTLDSSLPQTLKLDATTSLIRKGSYEWQYTSTCPIAAGRSDIENWPAERGPIRLSHFRFQADDKTTCE